MKRAHSWRRAESGFSNALIMILVMPLVLGMMGYVFDNARLVYLTQSVQSRADVAVQSAVNRAATDPVTSLITLEGAKAAAASVYCANTAALRPKSLSNVSCSPDIAVIGSPVTESGLCANLNGGTQYGLRLTVVEKIPTFFLRIIGIPEFTLTNLKSEALLRGRNC